MALKNKTHDNEKVSLVQRAPQQQVARASNEHERPLNPTIALKRAASAPPAALRPADILALQRTVGNRAVHRLLTGQAVRPQASESQSRQPIQAKLTVGAAGDKYEQEADRVASQIMSMDAQPANQSIQRKSEKEEDELQRKPSIVPITPLVQREVTPEDEEQHASHVQRQATSEPAIAAPSIENDISRARGSGHALPHGVRARMESAFRADFSGVRVHTDDVADRLNQSLQARAFTTGPHLFFKRGEYNPGSSSGLALIAHELAHVLQQNGWISGEPVGSQPMLSKEDGSWPIQRKIENEEKPEVVFKDEKMGTEKEILSLREQLFDFYWDNIFTINDVEATINKHLATLMEDKEAKLDELAKQQNGNWWKYMHEVALAINEDVNKNQKARDQAQENLPKAINALHIICNTLNRWEAEKKIREQRRDVKADVKADVKGKKLLDLDASPKGNAYNILLGLSQKYTGTRDTKAHEQHGANYVPKTNKEILTNLLDAQHKSKGPKVLEAIQKDYKDFDYQGTYRG